MARSDFLITRTPEGGWLVRRNGRPLASFPEKNEALCAAITLANAAGSEGQAATVTGVDAGGMAYTIWTYGVDALTIGE